MTDNPLRHNEEEQREPESPPGLTAQQYRTATYEAHCFALLSSTLTVCLLDDPHRARFTVECVVEPRGTAGAAEFVTEEWVYDIPALEGEISGVQAWDEAGTLQTSLHPFEPRATRLRVRFRHMVRNGSRYRFWYAYEAPVRTVVSTRMLSQTVMCTGWLIFNLPCESIRVCIQLPLRAAGQEHASRRGHGARAGADARPLSPGEPAVAGVVAVAGGVRPAQDRPAAVPVDGGAARDGVRRLADRPRPGRVVGPGLIEHAAGIPPPQSRDGDGCRARPSALSCAPHAAEGRDASPTFALSHSRTFALLS